MRRRELRLVPLVVTVWSAALLCVLAPAVAWGCAAACAALSGVALWVLLGRRRARPDGRGALALLLFATAGSMAAGVALAQPPRDSVALHDGRVVEVLAEVSSSSSVGKDGRLWFDVQTTHAGPPGRATPVSVSMRVGVEPDDGFDLGAQLRVVGEAEATDAGERAALIIFTNRAEILRPASGAFGVAARVRHDFVERSLRLPEPGAGLLPGLAVGDTRAVTPELNDDMRTSGLSHLTAVSGANCAIVVGAAFWVTALCGGGRTLRVVLSLTALASFVVLVTPEPSVVRAGVMAAVAMLAVMLGRPSAGIGVLSLSVTAILLADPWLAATPGFALSAAASAALVVLARPLAAGLGRWMPEALALAIAVPLSAQLVCGPIIALFAEQQSIIGIAANLLAAPAAPLATVIGLLACLAAPIPVLADLLVASAWLPSAWIASTAGTTAQLPVAQLLVVPGIGSALLVAVLSGALALVALRPSQIPARLRIARVGAAGVVIISVSLGGAHLILAGPLATATTPAGWAIAACDVGQGDALVVRSKGSIALIDTGPEPAPLEKCLRSLGVDRVDLLVLTHFDLDHVGGVKAVMGRVDTVMHGPAAEPEDERMLADLTAAGAALVEASAGMRGDLGAASWRVLWPRMNSAAFPAGNDASVVIDIGGGEVPRSVFLGDLSALPQRMLLGSGALRGPYPVVKVAHHGSADQDAGLYEVLAPSAALFSAGADNDYGHPRQETLDVLAAAGAHVLRTDTQGLILVGVRDGRLEVWTERAVDEEPASGSGVGDPG
ncbi:ComEC/Rec2 family competence protein [Microbacterium sp.]|uniref:ComEC/Rec2 family competence protein n=1 Tax=Microbacterium sp. TaxID=51671 RepID=UPI002811D490|nr:ComEC/Rec2 family competence protein [Microbacterium sp.]